MSIKSSTKEINQNKDSEKENFLKLTIHKHDSIFFHVSVGNFSTIDGMTKTEILEIEKRYKGNFNLIFKTKALEKIFNTHIDDPKWDI